MHPRRAISAGDALQSTRRTGPGHPRRTNRSHRRRRPPRRPRRSLSPENAPERDRPTLARRPDARTGFDETNVLHDVCQIRRPATKPCAAAAVIRRDENALFHALHVEHGHVLVRRRENPRISSSGAAFKDAMFANRAARRTWPPRATAGASPLASSPEACAPRNEAYPLPRETFRDLRAKFLEVWRRRSFRGKSESEAEDSGRRRRRVIRVARRRRRVRTRRRLRVAGFYRRLAAGADTTRVATPRTVSSPSVKTPRENFARDGSPPRE